ncbi:hypothetical protein F4703DRAFT_1883035, partial [Phycomyces blakesleeanus]
MQFLLARKLWLSMSWERAVFAQTSFLLEFSSSPSSISFASSSSVPFASFSSVPFASFSVSSSSLIVEDINPPMMEKLVSLLLWKVMMMTTMTMTTMM